MTERRTKWAHGTTTGYKNHACRCAPCREAWRIHKKAYDAQRKLRTASGIPEGITLETPAAGLGRPPATSWWTTAPRIGMTELVEREHRERMGKAPGRLVRPLGAVND